MPGVSILNTIEIAPKEVQTGEAIQVPGPAANTGMPSEMNLEMHKVGMICFLISEVAFFSTLITAYVVFLMQSWSPPTPRDTLSLPLVIGNTICLLTSSYTIHRGRKVVAYRFEKRLPDLVGGHDRAGGALFLGGTGIEWNSLIRDHGLTISRNMFGTAYYTLVGFHAFHVTLGVIALTTVWLLSARRQLQEVGFLASQPRCLVLAFRGWRLGGRFPRGLCLWAVRLCRTLPRNPRMPSVSQRLSCQSRLCGRWC